MAKRRVRVDRKDKPVPEHPAVDQEEPEVEDAEDSDEEPPEPCDCTVLDPADWHEVESDWTDIAFYRLSLAAVFGVPFGYQSLLTRVKAEVEATGAIVPEDPMILVGKGKFRRPVWIEVEEGDEGFGEKVVRPGGIAYTRLLPAAFGQIRSRFAETEELAEKKYGRKPDSMWTWYLTCKQCSAPRDFETLFVAHYKDRND